MPRLVPCLWISSQHRSELSAENNSHSLFAFPSPSTPTARLDTSLDRDLSPAKPCLVPAPDWPLFELGPFSWPPCCLRCTLIPENADLCSKPPCRQFPRHSWTVYLFIFVLAERRKSHRPKMNTNEMPSLASFVIRMKNWISAELQAIYFFPQTFFFFNLFCPFL